MERSELEAIRASLLARLHRALPEDDPIPHDLTPQEVADMTELICGDCLLCEDYQRDMDPAWRCVALCREILRMAPALYAAFSRREPKEAEEGTLLVFNACTRAADTLTDHPRLKHHLLKMALDLRISQGLEPDFELDKQVTRLAGNLIHADTGAFDKIRDERMLRHDPVEWTQAYEDVIHLAQQEAESELADQPRGMGFCFAYWSALARILRERYGITWRSPAQMNPRVHFD